MKKPKEIKLETIEWMSPEYIQKNHSVDWYWALVLITLLSVIIAMAKGNYIFGIFLFLSGASLFVFSLKKPYNIKYKMDSLGFNIRGVFYRWEYLKSFNTKDVEGNVYFKLLIETTKKILPIMVILVPMNLKERVEKNLIQVLKKSKIDETGGSVFMEQIGF